MQGCVDQQPGAGVSIDDVLSILKKAYMN